MSLPFSATAPEGWKREINRVIVLRKRGTKGRPSYLALEAEFYDDLRSRPKKIC